MNKYSFESEVWLYNGISPWHFASVPKDITLQIDESKALKRGWGSKKVKVTIGRTSWLTSIFPDKRSATYLLPIKAQVRKEEGILKGDRIKIFLELK